MQQAVELFQLNNLAHIDLSILYRCGQRSTAVFQRVAQQGTKWCNN